MNRVRNYLLIQYQRFYVDEGQVCTLAGVFIVSKYFYSGLIRTAPYLDKNSAPWCHFSVVRRCSEGLSRELLFNDNGALLTDCEQVNDGVAE